MTSVTEQGKGFQQVPLHRLWLALVALFLVLLVAVALYLWTRQPPEVVRTVPAPAVSAPPAELSADMKRRVRQLEELNRSLEADIARRAADPVPLACPPGSARKTDVAPGATGSATGSATQGAAQGAVGSPLTPAPLPAQPLPPPTPASPAGSVDPLPTAELLARLERGTALVVAEDSIATGFFITPELLVTNRHAVESAKDNRVVIASRSLGRAVPAQVVGASTKGPVGALDFALVRLVGAKAPGILPVTTQFGKLTGVTAAGYPGLTMSNDAGFRRLVAGDTSAAPDLNVTQGAVQAIQPLVGGGIAIAHTASILQGNSGGPLTDACGRVIGVNTFIAVDQEQSGRISYAQTVEALLGFVGRYGAALEPDRKSCASR